MSEPPDPGPGSEPVVKTQIKAIKTSLKSVIKDEYMEIINEAVIRMHEISYHAHNLINLYIRNLVDKGQYDKFPTYSKQYGIKKKDPKVKDEKDRAQQMGLDKVEDNTDGITERFFKDALRLVSSSSRTAGRQFQPEITCPSLNRFFQTEYSNLNFKYISRDKLNDVINSEAKSMYTAFENNIIAQYKNRLSEFINNIFNYKWKRKILTNSDMIFKVECILLMIIQIIHSLMSNQENTIINI